MPSLDTCRAGLLSVLMLALVNPAGAGQVSDRQSASLTATPLELGKPVELEIKGGETREHAIRLEADEIVEAVVDQRGVDLVVIVIDPDGKAILSVDSPNGDNGPEPVAFVAARSGEYRLRVRALDAAAKPGRYAATLTGRHVASERERELFEASRLLKEARNYRMRQMVKEALPLAERALGILEKQLGPYHPDVAEALYRCGDILLLDDDYDRSEPLLRRSLAIYDTLHDPEHPEVVLVLQGLAAIEWHRDRVAESDALLQCALEIATAANRPGLVIFVKIQLADNCYSRGDYAQAIALKLDVLEMRRTLLGPNHPDVSLSYSSLGATYVNMGDFETGERMFRRALEVAEKSLDANHPLLASHLNNIAMTCQRQGKLAEAEALLVRSLAINENAFGPESKQLVYALHNLGMNLFRRGQLDEAERYLRRALAIVEKNTWSDNSALVSTLSALGGIAAARDDVVTAEALARRELEVYDREGSRSDFIVGAATNVATFAWRKGDVDQALALFERADEVREYNVSRKLVVGSERQKRDYVAGLANDAVLAFVAHCGAGSPRSARLALSVVLRRKGRSIDETADTVGKLRTSASPEDRSLLNELADVRARRSGLALGRAHAQDEASDHDDAARLALRAEEIEALLGLRDPRLHAQTLPITVDRVRDSVPADTALLEYVRFDGSEPWKHAPEAHYAVVVVRRDADPVFADLGLAAPIDDEMARFRRDVRDPSSSVEQEARRLGSTLVQPIIASLDGVKRVLVSPDAGLNLLPFAALADESNRPLVERYEISYLTSGRDLLRLGERAVRRGSAMVVAAPDFVASAEGAPGGGARGGPVDLHEARFHALPATVPEARSIGRMLDAVDVLTGIRATEAALKHAHGPRVLHVATHGFFVDEAGAGGAPVTGSSANPLLRSGIALAGANRRDGGDGEDGILTALEASGLDLWGTKLVVLSACDTGLGEVRAGEGVYGLRRAMVLAGSETQVMSLWDIDDRATRELMVAYYRGLLSGAGRAEAMRRVQLRMMKDPKRRHPAYWASFIVSGDWRPLD